MILTCPSCGTQYVVKDGAIPPEGRQVRCASCKHSWHQDPEGASEAAVQEPAVEQAPIEPPAEDARDDRETGDESLAEATLIEPRSGTAAEERAFEEATIDSEAGAAPEAPAVEQAEPTSGTSGKSQSDMATAENAEGIAGDDWQEPPLAETQVDEFTPYPAADEVAPGKRSRILPVLLVILIVVAVAAAFWFLAPAELKARLGLAGVTASPLALVTTHMDRQRLASGNELLTVTGRVINPTGKEQDVPPLQAQLKTRAGKVVYSWTIAPPARTLGPGASASFNSAEVNVPPGGDELTITLGSGAS
jgi:predicted Zn finger-like uncharacterized protein